MAVSVREATIDDLAAILHLYAQPDIDDGVTLSMDDATSIFEKIRSYPSYRLFVAEHDGRIVGTFALLIMDNLGHLGAPSAIVEDVAVDPAVHRQGIGQTMMDAAMDEARQAGCYKLTLSSNVQRHEAHAFYDALGFERHGYSFRIDVAPP